MEKHYFDNDGTPEACFYNGKIMRRGLSGKKLIAHGYQSGFGFCDEAMNWLAGDEEFSHVEFYEDGSANLFFVADSSHFDTNVGVIIIRPNEKDEEVVEQKYQIKNKTTSEYLLYDESYDGVVWIASNKMHKWSSDKFLFTMEEFKNLSDGTLFGYETEIIPVQGEK